MLNKSSFLPLLLVTFSCFAEERLNWDWHAYKDDFGDPTGGGYLSDVIWGNVVKENSGQSGDAAAVFYAFNDTIPIVFKLAASYTSGLEFAEWESEDGFPTVLIKDKDGEKFNNENVKKYNMGARYLGENSNQYISFATGIFLDEEIRLEDCKLHQALSKGGIVTLVIKYRGMKYNFKFNADTHKKAIELISDRSDSRAQTTDEPGEAESSSTK